MQGRLLALALLVAPLMGMVATGCMPPSVEAVDGWLSGYAAGDAERVARHTHPSDRALVREALAQLERSPTGTLALALPARPLGHEIVEIEAKDEAAGRHVVLALVTTKNPLPFASERVGQILEDFPKTRTHRRRFLAVRDGASWGVKLDLARVAARAERAAAVQEALGRGAREAGARRREVVPAPPAHPHAPRGEDRLAKTLREELEAARRRAAERSPDQ